MAYTTREDLYPNRIGKQDLARLVNDTSSVRTDAEADAVLASADGQAILDQAITDYAEQEIDTRVEGHLDITDSRNIDKLERINATGALYFLERRRKKDEDNRFYDGHKANVEWLKQIQKREILTGANPETPAVRSISNRTSSDRAFCATDTRDF